MLFSRVSITSYLKSTNGLISSQNSVTYQVKMLQQSQEWHKHLFANHLRDAVPQGATHVLDDHVLLKEETEWEHLKEDASSDGHRSFLPALQGGHMLGVTLEGNFKSFVDFVFIRNMMTYYRIS